MSFSLISLPPAEPTFPEVQNISISRAVSGSLGVLPFPWAAVTPSAHTLQARASGAFWLISSIFSLLGSAEQQRQLHQCSHTTVFTAAWLCEAGDRSNCSGTFI